ncbi:acyl carrier protein [Streptomyces sp. NPDC057307]|uniref:acyl carrier protein n=1 Tax=Streptomyces sp. NPDC057307 TaxID=3346096 RepID=UPI0036307996
MDSTDTAVTTDNTADSAVATADSAVATDTTTDSTDTEVGAVTDEAVREKICRIVAEELDIPAAGLTPDQHFRSLPNVDSMRVLQIVLTTEKAFDIEIEDEVTFRVQTIGEFQGVVEDLCRQKTSA